ncbi:MAG: undecaprenyldiphospho-muramoylpentapeptide beta-N-acetylglucosaminyltransferase [Proteobacteria bacterium]|nr:MAG: undecaprenyldiphospho-muramoylpentapeptide beta-N-acetylglucosaminyltransferase [Pseudomonadota bacterium]
MAGGVMIMAGGTGGHVFPALAVAGWLRERGVEVTWMGTQAGLEARVVPAAGIPIEWVQVTGLRGKGMIGWLLAPVRLLRALMQALAILRRCRPRAVLGMGGFVTGPGGLASWLLRTPLLIHEQNAIPGLTNRLLARMAKRVMEAFPGTFVPSPKVVSTGNPVRPEIAALPEPALRGAATGKPLRLLVLGGSRGAVALNRVVPEAVAALAPQCRPEIWHQVGERQLEQGRAAYRDAEVEARVESFIGDMAQAYGWADLVLCRAGALTIAELTAAGVAALLVPYPHAVDDHQSANARWLVAQGGAELIPQPLLSAGLLAEHLQQLDQDRERLLAMAEASRRVAQPEATDRVGTQCLSLAGLEARLASTASDQGVHHGA